MTMPRHFYSPQINRAACGVKSDDTTRDLNACECARCFSITGPHYWRLQLERAPGEWIDTPHVQRGVKRPKLIPFDTTGRRTRWAWAGRVATT